MPVLSATPSIVFGKVASNPTTDGGWLQLRQFWAIYTGNRIPSEFLRTIESVGALDDDESILYFYSDAMTDIRDGFYFVSDRKVVIYSQATGESPLAAIPFDDIVDVELYRNESFFVDSEITIYLKDGRVLSLPVSSEYDRDQQFFDAIHDRIDKTSERA
jgi:hypothetical protein